MTVTIKGLDQLFRKLGKAAATKTLEAPMQRSVLKLQRRMQEYPPALASRQGPVSARTSKRGLKSFRNGYRRTGTYGRRWTARVMPAGNGLLGKVGNNVAYGPYVGSQQFQARVHRGRWNTDDQVVKEERAAIVTDFAREIDKALAG